MNNQQPKTKYNTKGFTLIELMVVITIIAILSLIGITVFTGVQKNARDAKRRADIDAIANAYEVKYIALSQRYADPTTGDFSSNAAPTDPGSYTYAYNTVNSAKGYWACARLETSNGNASGVGGAVDADPAVYPVYVSTNAGAYYCKSSQQ